MSDFTNIPADTFETDRPVLGSTHLAIVENLFAVAEGAPDAPRIQPDALDMRIAEVDPAGMASVVFTDLAAASWALEFYTIQPDSTANRALLVDVSYDNGVDFGSVPLATISAPANFRSTAADRLGGLSGFLVASNNMLSKGITGSPSNGRVLFDPFFYPPDTLPGNLNGSMHRTKPFTPVNAIRIRWNIGNFGADANQRIILYEGTRRPSGANP